MPNYSTHIDLADQILKVLDMPTLFLNKGSFLMGSTAPDIRIITKASREKYHFASIQFDQLGEGITGFFNKEPHLANPKNISDVTASFIAGFLTHIIADEMWIMSMYRPLFGNNNIFEDPVIGNFMDRVIQLDMDRMARNRMNNMENVKLLIQNSRHEFNLGFISNQEIALWRNWLLMAMSKQFSWERVRFMAKRGTSTDKLELVDSLADKFLVSIEQSIESLYEQLPKDSIIKYQNRVIEESQRTIRKYLE